MSPIQWRNPASLKGMVIGMTVQQLQQEIRTLKKETGAVILAHSYQTPDILEIADHTGDSYKLSTIAAKLPESLVVMCGVRFMAETIKMLSPEKTVLLPAPEATCPMAEQIAPQRVREYKKENPDTCIVAYINTTAALKAECDVCVTSSSALQIVRNIGQKDILFIPDKNLGSYVKENVPEKNITLWDGCCPVHNAITAEDCERAKALHPKAKLLMHPEIPAEALKYADVVGSTAAILDYALQTDEECIIGTENAILDYLKLKRPEGKFYPLSKHLLCPDMKLTTLMDVYRVLKGEGGEKIELSEELRLKAKRPIDEMIRLGQ